MITIYRPDETDFTSLGLCVLNPTECTVSEKAGGTFSLRMVHPLDAGRRWTYITPGAIIKAPAPVRETPLINYMDRQTTVQTITRKVYKVRTNTGARLRLRERATTGSRCISSYKPGTEVIKLADAGSADGHSWYRVAILNGGATGYMAATYLTYVRDETESVEVEASHETISKVVQPRQTRDQLFRIISVERDSADMLVTVEANHVFYDLAANIVNAEISEEGKDAQSVFNGIIGSLMNEHPFNFYMTAEGKCTGEYTGVSAAKAFLDPDIGIVPQCKARIIRDNFDVFILPDEIRDRGVEIRHRKNLVGATMKTDSSAIVTRIKPVGKTKDGNRLTLTGSGIVDSAHINDYPIIYAQEISYDVKVGDGEGEFANETEARNELARLAQAEFDAGCDLPEVSLDVDFVALENVQGYQQYAEMQSLHLYDSVRVIAYNAGIDCKLRVVGYDYNCLLKKYDSISLGDVYEAKSTVYGYEISSGSLSGTRIANGSIGGAQLRNLAVSYAKIDIAAIEQLAADALTAVSAHINQLVAGTIEADQLYADLAAIAVAEITTANIDKANIDWAKIATLSAQVATIAKAQITAANIESANIEWARIETLNAVIADIAEARINNAKITSAQITDLDASVAKIAEANIAAADIGFGQIKDLVAGTAIITEGVSGQLYISRLAVTEANMVSLSVGELIIKGSDGGFYALGVDADGKITTTIKQIGNSDVADLSINAGEKLIEGSVTAATLNANDIFANNAIIRQLIAANLEVDTLWNREAWMSRINGLGGSLDLTANKSIQLLVNNVEDNTSRVFRQEEAPEGARDGDLWIRPSVGQTWQYSGGAAGALQFALADDGQLAYAYADGETAYQLAIEDDGVLSIDADAGILVDPEDVRGVWLLVVDADEIDSRLTSAESAIVQTADQISLTVTRVETAQSAADAAQSTADAAQSTANTNASNIASLITRVSTAESSITQNAEQIALNVRRVETAQTVAGAAQSAANTAQSAANGAQSTANAAQSTANANASKISALTTRVTTSETAIEQNAAAINLRATKSELSALETRVETAELAVEPDSIAAVVRQKIALGGRNLALDTGSAQSSAIPASDAMGPYWALSDYGREALNAVGTEFTISFDAMASVSGARISVRLRQDTAANMTSPGSPDVTLTGEYARYAFSSATSAAGSTRVWFLKRGSDQSGSISIRNVKVELGNMATGWSPAPEDPVQALDTYSGVYINKDEIHLVSEKTTVAVPGENGEDDVARFDADGVHAQIIEADEINSPSVVATQTAAAFAPANAGELAAICENLRNVCLTGNVNIDASALTGGSMALRGVSGGYALTVSGGALNGAEIVGCTARIVFSGVTIATSGAAVTAEASPNVRITGGALNAGTGVLAREGARVRVDRCGGVCDYAADSRGFSEVTFSGATPGTDMPYGLARFSGGGQVYAGARLIAKPSAEPEPEKPTVQTVTLKPTLTRTYNGSWREGYWLWQGRYGTLGLNRGCMWFDTSAFAGKTVLSASLSLKRLSGAGSGVAVAIKICGTTATGASGTPAVGAQYASVSIAQGARKSVDVTSAVQALASGSIKGLMLYDSSTTNLSQSNNYTACYAKLYGYDSDDRPVLTVTYQ